MVPVQAEVQTMPRQRRGSDHQTVDSNHVDHSAPDRAAELAFAADGLSMQENCVWLRSWLATLASIVLPPPVWHADKVGVRLLRPQVKRQAFGRQAEWRSNDVFAMDSNSPRQWLRAKRQRRGRYWPSPS